MAHLFEFMDLDWLPSGLRGTLREILESGNNKPFRPYYDWVANELLRAARSDGFTTLVELGAGPAPVTRLLADDPRSDGLHLVPCDINPDRAAYEALARRHPGKVAPRFDRVDFSHPQEWEPGTLLFLSATFHHVPPGDRARVLESLTASADGVVVIEPLRKTMASMLFVLPSIVPALLLPVLKIARPGRIRRFVWCWLVPVAPLMFCWDGLASCLRMWTAGEWRRHLRALPTPGGEAAIETSLFCQMIALQGLCRPASTPSGRRGREVERPLTREPEPAAVSGSGA